VLALLITKPFEFKAKLMGHFASHKPTTVQFWNRHYVILELNTNHLEINNNRSMSYSHEDEKVIF
jgi:hypothetical protein